MRERPDYGIDSPAIVVGELVGFIFTKEAVRVLRTCGIYDASRTPIGDLNYWLGAVATLGSARTYQVTGRKGFALSAEV